MCSASRSALVVIAAVSVACAFAGESPAQTTRPGVLVVLADANNLPFSNDREEGFENRIAQLVARDLNLKLEYHFRALRRGYWREAIKDNLADVMIGVPRELDMALTTAPYYRSTYVFVTRPNVTPPKSLDDPILKQLRLGVPLTGEANPPPTLALARRGVANNITGFPVFGDYGSHDPAARMIDAVAAGQIDLALAWGPPAGYYAKRDKLLVTPITPQLDDGLPMAFDVSMGVAKRNKLLCDRLDAVIARRHDEIARILDDYAVPRVLAAPALERFNPDEADDGKETLHGCCE